MKSVYFNFFSIASLVPASMSLLIAGILISMRERSAATRRLAEAFTALFVWNSAYAVSFAVYSPEAGFHRWATIIGSQFALIFFTRFLFHYPRLSRPRLANGVFLGQLVVVALVDVWVVRESLAADYIFRFSAHYWDLGIDTASRVLGVLLLLIAVTFLAVGIIRAIRTRGRDRWTLAGIIATVFAVAMSAGVANSLSREGRVDFAVFVTIYSAAAVLANFLIFIIYVNNTRDRSTIMGKIIGISLVTILLMLQVPGYFSLRDRREAYFRLRETDLRRAVTENYRPPGLVYLRRYSRTRDEKPRMLFQLNPGTAPAPAKKESLAEIVGRSGGGNVFARSFERYGEDREGKSVHFVVVRNRDASGIIHEAGFSYRAYRRYLHDAAVRLAWILLALFVVVLGGYPLFFRGALVMPLKRLLVGVRRVNEGDMDVSVPVRVEDEIGFLSRSFNGMVDSIRDAREKLREYADGLEEKVEERTTELRDSLDRVRDLKDQQDGDYFLTSLLLRPLNSNRAGSGVSGNNIRVDFLIRQKKKFTFRKWDEEIGGDLCMARSISLRDRPHTVFLNADAMGKSMQGAGGALVLGAVFAALLERSALSTDTRNLYPERWLKYSFIELHKVFESFDGSMLVSLVMGLVDDESGLMYYINAEHPWSVLYRGGQASFLEDEFPFRKLGTQGADEKLRIKILQLEPGDVVIAGSDGRDDIRVSPPDGTPYVSDDETAFLRDVAAGKGGLDGIVSSILERGELTDDLSLLRISFREVGAVPEEQGDGRSKDPSEVPAEARRLYRRGEYVSALEILNHSEPTSDESARNRLRTLCHMKLKAYEPALDSAAAYLEAVPGDTEFLFLTSYFCGKLGRFSEAADLGERVRLRDPVNARNLLHLARVYVVLKNSERAVSLARDVLELEPENEKAEQLLRSEVSAG